LQNFFNDKFEILFRQLSPSVQKQASKAFDRLAIDKLYPSLKFKCVHQQKSRYAIRINKRCRALGHMIDEDVYWYWIGIDHDEYERRIND